MGKRENEYQLTKDDFEADEEDEGEKSPGTSFQRADPEVLAKRRFVRSAKRPASTAGTSSAGTGGAFANINLVPASANPISSQSALSSKPRFAMPSLPNYGLQNNPPATTTTTNAGTNPFGAVNLTGSTTTAKSGSQVPKSESDILTENFRQFIKTADLRKDYQLPAIRYLTTLSFLGSQSAANDTASTAAPSSASTSGVLANGSTSAAEKSKSLFAPAPAPVAFSFGSTLQNSTSSAPASTTPTFSFGSTSSSATVGAPAAGLSSGFNFAPAPMAAAPAPGTNVKIALSPVPAPSLSVTKPATGNDDGDDDDEPLPPEEKTELASADDDWDSLFTVKVRAYNYRNENKPRKFASGALKVQQHKESKNRRMVLRDGAGKVWINIGIFQGMNFTKSQPAAKPGSRPVGNVTFVGVNDKDRGGETFTLVCALSDLDGLHKILEESSS